ncbi:MAG: hypothetical protein OEY59_09355 [Deltaproteobacteria bacterium]|nr:hypothetical protein [Deltaproteobacteria bacterium]
MTFVRQWKFIYILLFVITLGVSSCELPPPEEDLIDDPANGGPTTPIGNPTTPSELEGTYSSLCRGSAYSKEGEQELMTYTKNQIDYERQMYDSAICLGSPLVKINYNGSFLIGDGILAATDTGTIPAKKIDYKISGVTMTPLDAVLASELNSQMMCGINYWSANVPTDISGKFCDFGNGSSEAIPAVGDMIYEIYALEGNLVYDSDYTSGDGKTQQSRPNRINQYRAKIKLGADGTPLAGNLPFDPNNSSELDGQYSSLCMGNPQNQESEKEDYFFHGNKVKFVNSKYFDGTCGTLGATFEYRGAIYISGNQTTVWDESNDTYQAKDIDFTIRGVFLKPIVQDAVTFLNQDSLCGFNDWAIGVEKDISGRSCAFGDQGGSEVMPNKGDMMYDIFVQTNNLLFFGDSYDATNDGSTPETRPQDIDWWRGTALLDELGNPLGTLPPPPIHNSAFGAWTGNCEWEAGNIYIQKVLFIGDMDYQLHVNRYSDTNCTFPYSITQHFGAPTAQGEKTLSDGSMAQTMDISFNYSEMTLVDSSAVTDYNAVPECLKSDWALNQPVDMGTVSLGGVCENLNGTSIKMVLQVDMTGMNGDILYIPGAVDGVGVDGYADSVSVPLTRLPPM